MGGSNCETRSSVKGMTRRGLNCVRHVTKWTNSEIVGTWIVGYSGFMDDVDRIR
jgi:hypothetical protein